MGDLFGLLVGGALVAGRTKLLDVQLILTLLAVREVIILILALALFGGFFIAKSLTDSGSLKGNAQAQEPGGRESRAALTTTPREKEIISTLIKN